MRRHAYIFIIFTVVFCAHIHSINGPHNLEYKKILTYASVLATGAAIRYGSDYCFLSRNTTNVSLSRQQNELFASIMAQAITREIFETAVKKQPIDNNELSAIMTAFETGTKIPITIDFVAASSAVFYSLMRNAGIVFNQGTHAFFAGLSQKTYIALDPLKVPANNAFHTTTLYCGKKNYFCDSNNKMTSSQSFDPNELILSISRLGLEASVIVFGIIFALLSYKLNAQIEYTFQLKPAWFLHHPTIVSTAISTYIDIRILDWFRTQFLIKINDLVARLTETAYEVQEAFEWAENGMDHQDLTKQLMRFRTPLSQFVSRLMLGNRP